MRLRKLVLTRFGPFKSYTIDFFETEGCLLLTGKNNEGKSTIISAIRFIDYATRVIGKRRQMITTEGGVFYRLLVQDVSNIEIKKTIYNYEEVTAKITAVFEDGFTINLFLDPIEDLIYCNYIGQIPQDIDMIFGIMPPLGPLNEEEELIKETNYLKSNINSSLAPRHLRNYYYKLLTNEEYELIKKIVKSSWTGIELLDYKFVIETNRLVCFYSEDRYEREISWAGQGLQVWFQIITHLVRLRNSSIIILDEPEINLHPEKQHDLIRIIQQYFTGSVIIATHSVELMNNVNISHIINVKKNESMPKMKLTSDRRNLEKIREEIGSNFNLVASQFEEFDNIVFTEDKEDRDIIQKFKEEYGLTNKSFYISINGFTNYKKCILYKQAYEVLMGEKNVQYTCVLDRDYYPIEQLKQIEIELMEHGIKVVFTKGKEIENYFISPKLLEIIIPINDQEEFLAFLNGIIDDLYYECHGSYLELHNNFYKARPYSYSPKTVHTKYSPDFDKKWENDEQRFYLVEGKTVLKKIRNYYQTKYKKNLDDETIISYIISRSPHDTIEFVNNIFL